MRRFAFMLFAGVPSVLAAQGFAVSEHNTCTMGRAGAAAASPCADGSAIYFSPAGLAGLAGKHLTFGSTFIAASGSFTDEFTLQQTKLDNPLIKVPAGYATYAVNPKLTVGIGAYAPYGLETKWPVAGFAGRFLGYNTKIHSIYIQPTAGYQVNSWLKVGIGWAYITSKLELHQRVDFSSQVVPSASVPPGTTFRALGIPTGTDFADANLSATGNGYAVNFGAIVKVNDRLSIGGHWLTRKTINYDGDARFTQIPTGLVLPLGHKFQLPPLCDTLTPCNVDNLAATAFIPGGALTNGKAHTTITLPPQGSIGFAYRVQDNWTLMADYQTIIWGWFATVKIHFDNPATPDIILVPHNNDSHAVRLGTEYRRSDKLTLRAGYLYHTSASPPDFVTPLLPENDRNEFTGGASYRISPRVVGEVAYQYIKQNDRRGEVLPAAGNTGVYTFHAHLFGAGVALTF